MDMNAFYLGRSAAGRCASTFLNEALFISAEIARITVPDDLKERITAASDMLHGSFFDINTENEEMDQLFHEKNRARAIHVRLNRLVEWLKDDVMTLGNLNADIAIRNAANPDCSSAYMLMMATSTNVMTSYNELFDAVKALPPFESLPVETGIDPGSFPAVNAPYKSLSDKNDALASELQAIADRPYEPPPSDLPMKKTVKEIIREMDEEAKRIRRENPDIIKWPGAIEPDPDDPMKPAIDGLLIAMHNKFKKDTKPDGGDQ